MAAYGQIARLAGLPNQARLVGYALHATPTEIDLPWRRVVNARGRISLPVAEGRYDLQKALLISEGVRFSNETVNLHRYQWNPTSSQLPEPEPKEEPNV